MKFLLFNVVVAGALVFLFAGDRADVGASVAALSDKAAEAVAETRSVPAGRAPEPEAVAPPAKTRVPVVQPAAKAPEAPEAPALPEPAPRRVASAAPPKAPDLPPDVAERREKVLGDLLQDGTGAETVVEVDPKKFMSPEQRRRDLILLSEEMELFSADTLSR